MSDEEANITEDDGRKYTVWILNPDLWDQKYQASLTLGQATRVALDWNRRYGHPTTVEKRQARSGQAYIARQ